MKPRFHRYIAPALLAATIPAAVVYAQSQPQPQPPSETPQARERPERPRLSEDARRRLREGRQEGRIAEIKQALKLDEAQLKLWAPVEQQMRAGFAARQKAREDWEQRRRDRSAERAPLPDRLDAMSRRLSERAQHMQAFAAAFKPFYAALSDEQKAVAGIVLRDMHGRGHGHGRRWAMEHRPRGFDGPGGRDPAGDRQPR
jgi:hypothetical protein